jgi:nucleotide-binding universal stress UspA family protein
MTASAGTIVVGVDGSESSLRALTWAVAQAVSEGRSLTLVHAIHAVTPAYMDAAAVYPQEARDALRADGQQVLAAAHAEVEHRAPGLEVHEIIRFEDPRELLLELSKEAALIVLGSRGRGKLRSLLLGSVGVALVRHAHCPVVIHRPGNPGTVRNGILVGADASEESRVVLEFAFREASLRGLPLTVVHCFWDVQAGDLGGYMVPEASFDPETEKMLLSESMAGMGEKYPDVAVTSSVARGQAHEVLIRLTERMDLVVVGAHQSGPVARMLFGSVSVAVVEHASCPVAVVPLAIPR